MQKRVITAVVGIPLVIAIVVIGNPYLMVTILGASLIGLFEFYRVVQKKYKPMVLLGYIATFALYMFYPWFVEHYYIYVTCLVLLALTIMVIKYPKYSVVDVALTLFPVFYVSLLFMFLVLIRDTSQGIFWIWLIVISAWGSDTCAYFAGVTLGKHKMAPELSPKKTIEGSIGGILGAGILGYLYTIIFTSFMMPELRAYTWMIVLIVMIAAGISQVGDLAASAIKRVFEQKDYGNILPGHGGILDRCDSFIFVAPVIYILALCIQSLQ